MKVVHVVALVLVIVGGLNWLLYGIDPKYNLVAMLLGQWSVVEKTVYILVGLSAAYLAVAHKAGCKDCSAM